MQFEFNKEKPLGEGGYGTVFRGKFDGRQVAVKRVNLEKASDNEEIILQQLDDPNIIKLFHYDSDDNFKYFVMELCAASLDQVFLKDDDPRKYNGPKLPHHLVVFLQLAFGLEYIHSKNLIHRDIKPQNVLISVDSNGDKVTMKWADFGLSRSVNERGTYTMTSGIKGTIYWYAPELLKLSSQLSNTNTIQKPRGTVKSDVFALALVFGYLLLEGGHLYGLEFEIPNNIMKNIINMEEIDRWHYARDFLQKMLEADPANRISSEQVVNELISIEIETEKKLSQELRELCSRDLDLNKIELIIQCGIDVNGKDDDGRNPLHLLCLNNSSKKLIDAIQLLIQHGFDVNEKDRFGMNALHLLCWNDSSEKLIDAIQLLIQRGINVKEKDKDGINALHFLCWNDSSEKLIDGIQLLIQHGIDVNEKNNGRNALHFLCRYNSNEKLIDGIQLLLQHGIDVNGKDRNGRNALHWLCLHKSNEKLIDTIQLLLQRGIDVNEKDIFGMNALHLLCWNDSSEKLIDAIQLLIQCGINVKEKDRDGKNALHLLCENNSSKKLIDGIQLLIHHGINMNGKDRHGMNALHLLCWRNSNKKLIDAIQLLIHHGINVNGKDRHGMNALHLLCWNDSSDKLIDAIQLLIQCGIDVKEKSNDGRNAFDLLRYDNPNRNRIETIFKKYEIKINDRPKQFWKSLFSWF